MRKIALLGEDLVQRLVERARRGEVAAERLLDDHARVVACSRPSARLLDHRREHAGRDRQVVGGTRGCLSSSALQPREGRRIVVVAVHVAQLRRELRERLRSTPPPCSVTLARARSTSCSRVQPDLATPITGNVELARGGPSPAARGRSSCRRGRRWRRRRPGRPSGSFRHALISSRRGRRSRSAWRTAPCSGSRPGRARRSARRAPRSARGRARPRRSRPPPSSALRPSRRPCRRTCRGRDRWPAPAPSGRAATSVTTLPRRHSSVMSARSKSYW